MSEDEILGKAIAFNYRRSEREGEVPWQPSATASDVWTDLRLVVLRSIGGAQALSFQQGESGRIRFRTLTDWDDELHTKLARRASKVLGSPEKAAPMLTELGLSTREIGALLGLSHETVRRSALKQQKKKTRQR